jgi:hypothetical protein
MTCPFSLKKGVVMMGGSNNVSTAMFGSELDPDSIRSVDPDSESRSGFRRAKMTHKN